MDLEDNEGKGEYNLKIKRMQVSVLPLFINQFVFQFYRS